MSRSTVNFLLDTALLVLFSVLVFCIAVMRFIFPPGMVAQGWKLWTMDYTGWSHLQFNLTALLSAGILVHVMLHWNWVCGYLQSRFAGEKRKSKLDDGVKTLYGVSLLIVILGAIGGALIASHLTIVGP